MLEDNKPRKKQKMIKKNLERVGTVESIER